MAAHRGHGDEGPPVGVQHRAELALALLGCLFLEDEGEGGEDEDLVEGGDEDDDEDTDPDGDEEEEEAELLVAVLESVYCLASMS